MNIKIKKLALRIHMFHAYFWIAQINVCPALQKLIAMILTLGIVITDGLMKRLV
jgi:hypothetical protein